MTWSKRHKRKDFTYGNLSKAMKKPQNPLQTKHRHYNKIKAKYRGKRSDI